MKHQDMTDERLSSLAILHIYTHKDVEIDGVVVEFLIFKHCASPITLEMRKISN